jgi:hypothetical protein
MGYPKGGLLDALGLVVDLKGDLLQLVSMLFAMVRAEEEFVPAGHGDADIRLRAAPIATIGCSQRGGLDDWCAHGRPRFLMIK